MQMFLELSEGKNGFNVYSDTFEYIGLIQQCDGIWKCQPEERVQDIDEQTKSEVDDILKILNQQS